MFGFGKTAAMDKEQLLRRAEDLRARRRPKQAVAVLRQILTQHPKDPAVHAKLGPLLASLGKPVEALDSFRIAATDLEARGFSERAHSLWLQVAEVDVTDLEVWKKLSRFHQARGHAAEAAKLLFRGATLQTQKHRTEQVWLLTQALSFDAHHLDATLMLAPLLVKERHADDARALLEGALTWCNRKAARRIRRLQFRLFPGLRTLWRWLRS